MLILKCLKTCMQFCGCHTRNPGSKYIHVSQSSTRLEKKLRDALEELGYIVRESTEADELSGHLDERPFDLVVIGLSGGGVLANEFLTALTVRHYAGKVLVVGRPDSPMVKAVE